MFGIGNKEVQPRKGLGFCAVCSEPTQEVLDYGEVALAGAFLKPEGFASEKRYPLRLHFCPGCYVVQVPDRIDRKTLFTEYFYLSSATSTMRNHFKDYAARIVDRFHPKTAIEIGCNDGVLLKPLRDLGVKVTGVDPSSASDGVGGVIREFWSAGVAKSIGKVDMVIANNVFAHIEDIHEATKAVSDCLNDDGVFVFEVNALDNLIADLQYDWVYHEHLFYWSLLALEKLLAQHGLEIFDLNRIATHAGSIRFYVGKSGKRKPSRAVHIQKERELWMGLDRMDRFTRFARDVLAHREALRALFAGLNGRIAGYGACGRTNTLLQFCGLSVDYIVDDAPAKHGFYTPGTHIPIVPLSELKRGDAVVVFAWSFLKEIAPKISGHRLIIPLPQIDERAAA